MRILELRLLKCGPFSDFSLDLSGGDRGLHLIYGPNEAGKSSALRAITYLCFGFPPQLNDAFLHPYSALRVGARVLNDQGEELDFVRRKAIKNSLRDRDDTALVNEDDLRQFLGGIDPVRFKTFFGIDHAMLVKGGKEIAEGGGDTGQILFSAGGANDLREVLGGLEKDAEKLFAANARNRDLNQLLSQLAEARKSLRDNQLPAREWEQHHEELERWTERKQTAELASHEKIREKSRLERIAKALPLIAALTDLRRSLSQLSDVVLLPADFPKRRQKAQEELRTADLERNRATAKADELQRQLDELAIPQNLIEQRAQIEPLAERLGVFRQAHKDRPALEAEARHVEEAAVEILRKLGKGLDLVAAGALQLPEGKRVRIRNVGEQYVGLVKEVDNWTSKLAELKPSIEENTAQIARLPVVQDVGTLSTALQDTLRLGHIEAELSAGSRDCESAAEQLMIALKRLPLWSGTIEEIESLQVPLTETIDRFDGELTNLDQEKNDLDRKSEECRKDADEVNRTLEAQRLEFDLPTEADLRAARDLRERGWRLIRTAWLAGESDPVNVREFLAAVGEGDDLAGAFEHSVAASDQIADRLRREADRVAVHAQLLAQQADCAKRILLVAEQQQATTFRREQKLAEWNRLWRPICDAPLSPREMRVWSRKHSELVQQAQALRRERVRIEQLQSRVADRHGRLSGILAAFDNVEIPSGASLEQLVGIAQQVLADVAAIAARRRELGSESTRLEKERKRADDRLAASAAKLLAWQEEWAKAIADLPLDARGSPSEANAVLDLLAQLSQQQRHIHEQRGRITKIDRYADEFTADVRALAAEITPELGDLPVANVAAELGARLSNAVAADRNRTLLKRQLSDERQNLAAARNTIAKMQSQLAALCAEAKCPSPANLPIAEQRSDERRHLEKEIQGLENRLREFSAGQSLAVFIAEAQSIDADTLAPEIRQLDEQIAGLDHELKDELGPAIGAEQTELRKMDCSAKAADAAERVQDLTLQIAFAAQEYARLQIALVALRKGIERYRQRHQGPIIKRSSEIFARLTLGAFSGLREDYGDDGRPELVAVRSADERIVRMAEMSDGTADQLFLAVRLAWLDEYLGNHSAIPFIVDDILIRFDDERSAATLQVLAELSARTQVILFTHHRHVVEIAQRALDGDMIFVHELPTSSVRLEA